LSEETKSQISIYNTILTPSEGTKGKFSLQPWICTGRRSIAPVIRKFGTREGKECLDLCSGRFTYRKKSDVRYRR